MRHTGRICCLKLIVLATTAITWTIEKGISSENAWKVWKIHHWIINLYLSVTLTDQEVAPFLIREVASASVSLISPRFFINQLPVSSNWRYNHIGIYVRIKTNVDFFAFFLKITPIFYEFMSWLRQFQSEWWKFR